MGEELLGIFESAEAARISRVREGVVSPSHYEDGPVEIRRKVVSACERGLLNGVLATKGKVPASEPREPLDDLP